MISTRALTYIAFGGGFFVLGSAGFFKWKIESSIKQSDYYLAAVKQLKQSETASRALGKPIQIGTPNLGDNSNNYCDGFKAKFIVPVKGSKDSGTMIFTASKNPGEKWNVNNIDLFLSQEPDKKLTLRCVKSSVASST